MKQLIENTLMNFVTQDNVLIENLFTLLKKPETEIVEIIGDSGSGRSSILQKAIESFPFYKLDHKLFLPSIFRINHFAEMVKCISGISEENLQKLVDKADKKELTNRYDLFYYITEHLETENLIKPQIVVIYESSFLNEYTLDFIKYISQSSAGKLQFIIFSRTEKFPLAQQIKVPQPGKKEIEQIISVIYPKAPGSIETNSEIISNITGGSLFLIEYTLNKLFKDGRKIDSQSYLDKKLDLNTIYRTKIEQLKKEELRILLLVYLLDTGSEMKKITEISGIDKANSILNKLKAECLILHIDNRYFVRNVAVVEKYFRKFPEAEQQKFFKIPDKKARKRIENKFNENYDVQQINYLKKIKDYSALVRLYEIILKKKKDPENEAELLTDLGFAYHSLHQKKKASEKLRSSLKLKLKSSLPAEKTVYMLAENLFAENSPTFALEIIRKYSPETIDQKWNWKLLMLKTEILIDMEKFDEALAINKEAYLLTSSIEDKKQRINFQATCKKVNGLINYYANEWNKAEREFQEAESLFKTINDHSGLAAIYNNLGGIAMLQGEWQKAETLFNKSLDFEKKSSNLNGISGCYSNLGYLFESKGDYQKSLHYLNEALKIQKLLDDRDVMIKIYINIGVTYMDNGEFDKASEILNQLLEIVIKFNLYRSIIATLNNLGAVYFKSGEWTKAIDHYERAIKKARENNFSEGLCQSFNNLGELYEKRGGYTVALDFYSRSMELLPHISDEFLKAEIFGNMGSVLTRQHKFGEAYRYLVESYDFFHGINAKDKVIEGSLKQAQYFILSRNFETALYHLDSAFKLAEEMDDDYQMGKCYFLKSFLDRNNTEEALKLLKSAIEKFISTNNNFEHSLANYHYAEILLEKDDWEQALQILQDNKKLLKKFGAINLLENNDILIQKINKKYAIELKESKQQESLLNNFYEITQNLNLISDFDTLIRTSIADLVDFSEADGGLLCLNHNQMVKDSWEYILTRNFTADDKNYSDIMQIIDDSFQQKESKNFKQPHFAPEYNNIITFPLSIRNDNKGVVCLFSKHDTHYFTDKMLNLLNALCNQIIIIVENILHISLQKSHEVIREELAAKTSFSNIIGKSKNIQEIFRLIEKIKNVPTTVLLEGPSGTGKELIARAIHYNSNRRNKKFVAQYCGALPETLLESELFGHVKGSFTGAIHDKKGLFEIANGGTFFLDEIGDISLSTQAKLLRFLQEGEIKKVGSTKTEKVDVRVICATNSPLKKKVDDGSFRLDLFYRLNVIKIDVPSLQQRKSDIPLLAIHFLDKYCQSIGKKVNGITDEAMNYLKNYDWPGNIRQLENEIERAVTLAEPDSYIKASDLTEEISNFREIADTIQLLDNSSMKDAVEKLEIQMIRQALEETDWNQTKTAKKLKLSRQGLIKKIQRYGLKR